MLSGGERRKGKNRRWLSPLSYVIAAFLVSALINGYLFYFAENIVGGNEQITFWRGLYWALVTMATVGYGDVVPTTFWGHVVAGITIIIGIAIFTMLVSTLASEFMNRNLEKKMGLRKLKKQPTILVIGDHENCKEVINELIYNLPPQEIAWLLPEPPKIPPRQVEFVSGDPSEEDTLERARIREVKKVVICMKEESRTLHIILLIRKMNKHAEIIATTTDARLKELMMGAGATYVIPQGTLGRIVASAVYEPSVAEFIGEVTTARGTANLIERIASEEDAGKTLQEYVENLKKIENLENATPVAIKRNKHFIYAPRPEEKLNEKDRIILLVAYKQEHQ